MLIMIYKKIDLCVNESIDQFISLLDSNALFR
jgi:hypothetical protein